MKIEKDRIASSLPSQRHWHPLMAVLALPKTAPDMPSEEETRVVAENSVGHDGIACGGAYPAAVWEGAVHPADWYILRPCSCRPELDRTGSLGIECPQAFVFLPYGVGGPAGLGIAR